VIGHSILPIHSEPSQEKLIAQMKTSTGCQWGEVDNPSIGLGINALFGKIYPYPTAFAVNKRIVRHQKETQLTARAWSKKPPLSLPHLSRSSCRKVALIRKCDFRST
jgi:hypothetical protein